jgi:hypothetical protein
VLQIQSADLSKLRSLVILFEKKMEEKPVERLIRLGNKKDRSINYLVVEAI